MGLVTYTLTQIGYLIYLPMSTSVNYIASGKYSALKTYHDIQKNYNSTKIDNFPIYFPRIILENRLAYYNKKMNYHDEMSIKYEMLQLVNIYYQSDYKKYIIEKSVNTDFDDHFRCILGKEYCEAFAKEKNLKFKTVPDVYGSKEPVTLINYE